MRARAVLLFAAGVGLGTAAGCAAVYPEFKTPLRAPPSPQAVDPPPPKALWFVAFKGATVPATRRDGRAWDETGNGLPDPYAVLKVNGREILRTGTESDTLSPRWESAPAGNFRFRSGDRLRAELWDANPVADRPIGVREFPAPEEEELRLSGPTELELESGARLLVLFEPAHAQYGLGLFYELRGEHRVFVTRTYAESPASRAGLRAGDEIVHIDGKPVRSMDPGQVQSAMNTQHPAGMSIQVRHSDASLVTTSLKEGSVYPLFGEFGPP